MFDEGIGLTELNYFIHMPCHSYRTKHDIFFSSYIKKILFQLLIEMFRKKEEEEEEKDFRERHVLFKLFKNRFYIERK